MKADILIGLQWGDEGKGKIVDVLTPRYNIIARFQGGPNAGHTLEFNGHKHVLHTIPSGIFHENTMNVVGNGVVIDPVIFVKELIKLSDHQVDYAKNLFLSRKAHLILPTHRLLDAANEAAKGKAKIGSTLKGIGPTYTDKVSRNGLRIGDIQQEGFDEKYQALKKNHLQQIDHLHFNISQYKIDDLLLDDYEKLWFDSIKKILELKLIDSEIFINASLNKGKTILAEGAQGTMLDIDFGSYPFVTSSNTISAGVCTGLGIAPTRIGNIYGIFKAYCTRVGSGPFPTELNDETGEALRQIGHEFGSTTGRPRRCGWLDLPALRYSIMLNGVTHLMMMKADVLSEMKTIRICTHYKYKGDLIDYPPFDANEQDLIPVYKDFSGWKSAIHEVDSLDKLPKELIDYIAFIEDTMKVPIILVSVGPDRQQTIVRKKF